MDNIEFEKLLGQHISLTEKTIGSDFKKLFSENSYVITDEFIKKDFYGMKYSHLYVLSDTKEKVESISVLFRRVIDNSFYNSFVQHYGKPDNIHVVKNRQLISEHIERDENGNTVQTLRRSESDLIEGTFEDKPLFIIWKKDGYEIKAFLRHEMNISEITFKISE